MERIKLSQTIRKKILDGTFKTNLPKIPWNKNLTMKDDCRIKATSGCFKKGQVSPNKGKIMSKEAREKMRIAKLGKKQSKEHIINRTKNNIGTKRTLEQRNNIRNGLLNAYKNGIKPWNKDKTNVYSKEHIEFLRENFTEIRKKIIMPMEDTTIELKIQEFLKELKIGFFTHYYCKEIGENAYQCDIFIPVQRNRERFIREPIIIECSGNYFHCNPIKYNADFVRYKTGKDLRTAQEIWDRDRLRTKLLEEKGFKVIILWESDIRQMTTGDLKQLI
jgi:G:T-mismatch repair DNA endonuclease (very short patch repair protein)